MGNLYIFELNYKFVFNHIIMFEFWDFANCLGYSFSLMILLCLKFFYVSKFQVGLIAGKVMKVNIKPAKF